MGVSPDDERVLAGRHELADDRVAGQLARPPAARRRSARRPAARSSSSSTARRRGAGAPSRGCGGCRPARSRRPATRARRRGTGTAAASTTAVTPLARAILQRWPSRPKPVTSVAARSPAATAAPRGVAVELGHHGDRLLEPLAGRLVAVVEDAEAERLGQRQRQSRAAPRRCAAAVSGSAEPGDGQAVLRLGVVDAVPAGEVRSRPRAHVGAAAQHLAPRARRGSRRAASRAG